NFGPDTKYELCITEPSSTVNCIPMVPFSAPQPDGRRISAVVCTAYAGPGTYNFSWLVGGVYLGPSLPASSTASATTQNCANYTG
ncbi:MAG: hypothetical protein ACYDHH_21275, partial [Solirubrobacteraceae bacterium]